MYVDIHAHLELLEGFEQIIADCASRNIEIVAAGVDPESNRKVLELGGFENVHCAVGLYPFNEKPSFDIDSEVEFIRSHADSIVGIGEVGLDGTYSEDLFDLQEDVFRKMIRLSLELDKFLVVHSRKAEKKVIDILEEEGAKKVVMHCFCGKSTLIDRAAKLGYYFSVPANLARAENFQSLVSRVSINQLLTETDSPYLARVKGEVNTPLAVVETVSEIAAIKKFDVEETRMNLMLNWKRLRL